MSSEWDDENTRTYLDLDVGDLTPVEEPVCQAPTCGLASYVVDGDMVPSPPPAKCCVTADGRYGHCATLRWYWLAYTRGAPRR